MGGVSVFHLIVLLGVLGVGVAAVGLVVFVVFRGRRK